MNTERSEYSVRSTSKWSAVVDKDIPLDQEDESALTRRIARAEIVDNSVQPDARIRICLMHQRRRTANDAWEDVEALDLRSIPAGKEIKLQLKAGQTYRLYNLLRDLFILGDQGIPFGQEEYVVARKDQAVYLQGEEYQTIQRLAKELGDDFWGMLEHIDADILKKVALTKLHESRVRALGIFRNNINNEDALEEQWHKFFSMNPWIFGYGLSYYFLSPVANQPHYGGTEVDGTGGQRGDFLLRTNADVRFTVLVEIKKPSSLLVTDTKYRNKVYQIGPDLIGGVAQLQSNCRTWDNQGARQEDNIDTLENECIFTCQPKGILIIGQTQQLESSRGKRQTFELFRQNLHNPEIITFDELLARAEFIVSNEQ